MIGSRQLVLFFSLWFAFSLITVELINSFFIALVFIVLLFFGKKLLPRFKKFNELRQFEKDFGFALMSLSTQLSIGLSFEQAMKNIAETDYGIVSKEFERALNDVEKNNSSIGEALLAITERFPSAMAKRGISQIISVYDKGRMQAAADVKSIALEILSEQKNEAKAFTSKIAMLSMLFIAVSAILPALFQGFVIVGSMFLEMDISPMQLLAIICIVFPLIDLAMLSYIKIKTPAFLGE